MSESKPHTLLLLLLLFPSGFGAGVFFRAIPPPTVTAPSSSTVAKVSFQDNECPGNENRKSNLPCAFKLTPKTMTLRFVSDKEFKEAVTSPAVAFARPYSDPCEIVIPTGATIESDPATGNARWAYGTGSYHLRDTLAHEILHCYTGLWHDSSVLIALRAYRAELVNSRKSQVRMFKYQLPLVPHQSWESDYNGDISFMTSSGAGMILLNGR